MSDLLSYEVDDVARASEQQLIVDDDMGYVTTIRALYGDTFLSLRRAVREMNCGTIPIYSDYDCTGLLCGQWCKFIKVYRAYGGKWIGIVEIRRSYDV